jgi:putative transposase
MNNQFHASALRRHRYSATGHTYLLTTVTYQRAPLFYDLHLARLVIQQLREADLQHLTTTHAFMLMPDHLHWLVTLEQGSLQKLMSRTKSRSSHTINHHLHTPGQTRWQQGYHDHAVRHEEQLLAMARYLIANPLRAGLVQRVGDWPHWDARWL